MDRWETVVAITLTTRYPLSFIAEVWVKCRWPGGVNMSDDLHAEIAALRATLERFERRTFGRPTEHSRRAAPGGLGVFR
jgi:hypothetical protein